MDRKLDMVFNTIKYIEKIESEIDGGYGFNDGFVAACNSIKMKVYEHLTDFQKKMLKELSAGQTKDLTDVWKEELTQSLELHDLGLCESESPNVLVVTNKGRKLNEYFLNL